MLQFRFFFQTANKDQTVLFHLQKMRKFIWKGLDSPDGENMFRPDAKAGEG